MFLQVKTAGIGDAYDKVNDRMDLTGCIGHDCGDMTAQLI